MFFLGTTAKDPDPKKSWLPLRSVFQQSGQVSTFLSTIEIEVAIENEPKKTWKFSNKTAFLLSKFSIIEWCLFR